MGKDNRITIRLDDETFKEVSSIAEDLQMNKSEVLRLALFSELKKMSDRKNKYMQIDERTKLIEALQDLINAMNNLTTQIIGTGTNINQIAKKLNTNHQGTFNAEVLDDILEELEIFTDNHEEIREEVNDLWQSFV